MLKKENLKLEVENIEKWIREYVKNSGAKGVVVGNSGGKDSGTVIALSARALRKRECNGNYYALQFKARG